MDRGLRATLERLTMQTADVRETVDEIKLLYGERYQAAAVVTEADTALRDFEQAVTNLRRAAVAR